MPSPTTPISNSDLIQQRQLISTLCSHGNFLRHPRIEETHISWVLLSGRDAYKIKKSVNLGFLDFTSLQSRNYYCNEELRLNLRLAPRLYLDVVSIGGTHKHPILGSEPAIEYAVHMRRFSQVRLMKRMLTLNMVTPGHIDKLAAIIARFHMDLPPAPKDSPFCGIAGIEKAFSQNFEQLPEYLYTKKDLTLLDKLQKASHAEFLFCEQIFHDRGISGLVRECHGDLHLGNIVILDDIPTPFDCIEFNASLRWIDVISEISFPVMDLLFYSRPNYAWRLLNTYLEITGDYLGCRVLRFYLAYRAMVRAKISAILANQRGITKVNKDLIACRKYLRIAQDCLMYRRPILIITHGLPGSGKSTFARIALERLGGIRLRSDVERKRLHGLTPLANSNSVKDIYSPEATRRTYSRLLDLAQVIITAGFPVIVDAAFLLRIEREEFHELAQKMSVPYIIASIQADDSTLIQRLSQRINLNNDASEADISVMKKLQLIHEPLADRELANTVFFTNNGDEESLHRAVEEWKALDEYMSRD